MRIARRVFAVALFVAALIGGWRFAAENGQTLSVDLLLGETPEAPLWGVLLASFGAGVLLSALLAFYRGARLRLAARRYRREVRGLEAEVHQLRNLPLASGERAVGEAELGV